MLTADALKHRLQNFVRQEKNRAEIITAVKADMTTIHEIAGPMVDLVIQLAKGIIEIYEISGFDVKRMGEVDPYEGVDKGNDILLMIEHLKLLGRLQHIDTATRIEVLDDELIEPMITELMHLPDGPGKLMRIKAAIDKIKSPG